MTKNINEMVFGSVNYTDKIHTAIQYRLREQAWMTFTIAQLRERVVGGYEWLKNLNERQTVVLNKILKTGIQKLVQKGLVKKVHSKMTVEPQWQWAAGIDAGAFVDITGQSNVAQTKEAQEAVTRRALGGKTLWRLNQIPA